MRIIELFEAQIEQDVFNELQKQISNLNKLSIDFDIMIDRFGYNVASKKIESRLYEMELTDWYYTVSVLTNLKLSMTLNNRNKLISNLRKRIKTGI